MAFYRLYIDEVGIAYLGGPSDQDGHRYLSLTGVIISRENHTKILHPLMHSLKADFFGHSSENPVILHRREILRREGAFAVLNDPEKRGAFNVRLLKLIADPHYKVITVTIDKKAHLDRYTVWRYDPYHYCLECMLERYVSFLESVGAQGDVCAEPRMKKVDKKLKRAYAALYEKGTNFVRADRIQRVLTSKEIKLSAKLENIAGMQLSDLLAHPSYRGMKLDKEGIAHPSDFGSTIYETLKCEKYLRGTSGFLKGVGQKWLP